MWKYCDPWPENMNTVVGKRDWPWDFKLLCLGMLIHGYHVDEARTGVEPVYTALQAAA
jgi:hypothetical protein